MAAPPGPFGKDHKDLLFLIFVKQAHGSHFWGDVSLSFKPYSEFPLLFLLLDIHVWFMSNRQMNKHTYFLFLELSRQRTS